MQPRANRQIIDRARQASLTGRDLAELMRDILVILEAENPSVPAHQLRCVTIEAFTKAHRRFISPLSLLDVDAFRFGLDTGLFVVEQSDDELFIRATLPG